MENTKMKSSVLVALIALLFGLIGQATAAQPSSYTRFRPDPSETITIDQLLKRLGSTFDTDDFTISASNAQRVFWKLESSKDKNKAGAILEQYSVQQLLDLNTWTLTECSYEGLKKRQQICESFCSRDQTDSSDPPDSLIEVNRKEAFIKHNLGNYCWTIVEEMQDDCPPRQLRDQLSRKDLNKVWGAFSRTRRTSKSSNGLLDIEGTKKNLTGYLAKKGPLKSAELWNHCSKVVEVYDAPRPYKLTVSKNWFRFVEFCRAFTDGFTQGGHDKDDLKRVEID